MASNAERSEALEWFDIAGVDDIIPGTGAPARLGDKQIAVFRDKTNIYAIDNLDPFSDANVLSRGLLADMKGRICVASPVYKQHFCLKTGECLEDATVNVRAYPVTLRDERILVGIAE
jgi:nitrite reductase (NADH) small subunit